MGEIARDQIQILPTHRASGCFCQALGGQIAGQRQGADRLILSKPALEYSAPAWRGFSSSCSSFITSFHIN